MNKVLLSIFILGISSKSFAGDAENITACVRKAKEFSGVTLDEFSASYEGNILSMSTVKWNNAFCEVKLRSVYTLNLNGQELVYKGYAGIESYNLNVSLQAKTEAAANQLNSRIALINQRAEQVSVSLKKPKQDLKWLTRYVDEGIDKSLGKSNQVAELRAAQGQKTGVQSTKAEPIADVATKKENLGKLNESTSVKVGSELEKAQLNQEILIPRSTDGDKGKYYLLEVKRTGNLVKALHKRVGVDAIGYTRTEIDCQSMQMRQLGYSEESPSSIQERPADWSELFQGSSKSDLVNFVCK